jgi:hypothetical protein
MEWLFLKTRITHATKLFNFNAKMKIESKGFYFQGSFMKSKPILLTHLASHLNKTKLNHYCKLNQVC